MEGMLFVNANLYRAVWFQRDRLAFKANEEMSVMCPQWPSLENRASASGSVDSEFDSESSQTNDLTIGIRCLPA